MNMNMNTVISKTSNSVNEYMQTYPSLAYTNLIKRNGEVKAFEPAKIAVAIRKAFIAVEGQQAANSAHVLAAVDELMRAILSTICSIYPQGGSVHIEAIQDNVEKSLMTHGFLDIAKSYILYRSEQQKQRANSNNTYNINSNSNSNIISSNIKVKYHGADIAVPIDIQSLSTIIQEACINLNDVDYKIIVKETLKNLYDGIPFNQVLDCSVLSARTLIEKNPDYSFVAARILLHSLREEVLDVEVFQHDMATYYMDKFSDFINKGVENNLLNKELLNFDLVKLAKVLNAQQDLQLNYLGLQTLYDRYFIHIKNKRIELPQFFFMRVAMGLALQESDGTREDRAIEFYNLLSSFDFMSSTPTLFNSATNRSQLSSCYLSTISDDLEGIYDALKENALLSKFAGGLGNDWTNVRALGSWIKGTNGKSQGVIPFLKVANDTLVAVNQGGKRLGSGCAYLETWHLDIEAFLELRKNTGDERRRCHDMNSANWIPDLFMQRVMSGGMWTLFSPSDVPDLHDLYGKQFKLAYEQYEKQALAGKIELYKQVPALDLWRKMISMLFETGHPWITFKDPCNIRSPQQHVGVVHSSNLCTEITLNTNNDEIAVCNLGSVNLVAHLKYDEGQKHINNGYSLDLVKLEKTITTAMRMLDNVIDINFYAIAKAKNSNMLHRPVGMGLMGFQDCLHKMGIAYASLEAVKFADNSTESLCYYAYLASSKLALERGTYSTYEGSLWSKGILPQDTIDMVREARGGQVEVDQSSSMDWSIVRSHISRHGMRNSNCFAIAPTATISNIIGVSACIEPTYQNLYVKSNLSGEFTIINQYLVKDLQKLGLWDEVMIADIKYFDGSLHKIDRIPTHIKQIYSTAFEIDTSWLIECAARRQKWIDQAQSLNIYMAGASGKKLSDIYQLAWLRCLKTTYYLRTMGATHAEKSTINTGSLNAVATNSNISSISDAAACYLRPGDKGFEECEACQ
jgi:ribonucleoside-diphosphate reductase alpha chain